MNREELSGRLRQILSGRLVGDEVVDDEQVDEVIDALDDLLDEAWGIIANVGSGDWRREKAEWQLAAHRWAIKAGYRQEGT